MKKIYYFIIPFLFFLILFQFNFIWNIFDNYFYKDLVYKTSAKYNIDPLLIFSIIRSESNFFKGAQSNKGAIGLMQIMPELAKQYVEETNQIIDDLLSPEDNITVGVWYVSKLKKMFNNDIVLTLAAYNSGENNVKKWLKENPISDVEYIPYKETRSFVRKTLICYKFLHIFKQVKKYVKVI